MGHFLRVSHGTSCCTARPSPVAGLRRLLAVRMPHIVFQLSCNAASPRDHAVTRGRPFLRIFSGPEIPENLLLPATTPKPSPTPPVSSRVRGLSRWSPRRTGMADHIRAKALSSPLIESAVEIVSGIPQLVYKIPLENNSSAGVSGIAFADLFDRIILGPTQFQWASIRRVNRRARL
jgi:hypothetical protein